MAMDIIVKYEPLPTLRRFHESPADIRCIVGPVGSGKTSAAAWDIFFNRAMVLYQQFGLAHSRWVIVRNTYRELQDTTLVTVRDWFPWGKMQEQKQIYTLRYPRGSEIPIAGQAMRLDEDLIVEALFRACDRPDHVKHFKSLEVSGGWVDESIEVKQETKLMLKGRYGRWKPKRCPVRCGIETTNPPDVEHPLYHEFAWQTPVPGPLPTKPPLEKHVGFWQPPYENVRNLRPGYYDDLRNDYADNEDWADMYVDGKPGAMVRGKLVYNNFKRDIHVGEITLRWTGQELYRGWDNTGLCPACVIVQQAGDGWQVLAEYTSDKMGIVDFTRWVVVDCNRRWPDASYTDYADPAGSAKFSTKKGDLTSNAKLMADEVGVHVIPSEQSFRARVESVEQIMKRIGGLLIDPECIRLINGFMAGYVYPEIGASGVHRETPAKNRFSHVHDALQYAMVKLTTSQRAIDPRILSAQQSRAESEYDVLDYA